MQLLLETKLVFSCVIGTGIDFKKIVAGEQSNFVVIGDYSFCCSVSKPLQSPSNVFERYKAAYFRPVPYLSNVLSDCLRV